MHLVHHSLFGIVSNHCTLDCYCTVGHLLPACNRCSPLHRSKPNMTVRALGFLRVRGKSLPFNRRQLNKTILRNELSWQLAYTNMPHYLQALAHSLCHSCILIIHSMLPVIWLKRSVFGVKFEQRTRFWRQIQCRHTSF